MKGFKLAIYFVALMSIITYISNADLPIPLYKSCDDVNQSATLTTNSQKETACNANTANYGLCRWFKFKNSCQDWKCEDRNIICFCTTGGASIGNPDACMWDTITETCHFKFNPLPTYTPLT